MKVRMINTERVVAPAYKMRMLRHYGTTIEDYMKTAGEMKK